MVAILDGQQRLTALYVGLMGTYAYKIHGKRWQSDDAFPIKKLYLNLLSPAIGEELRYEFSFKTMLDAEVRDEKHYWFEIGKILQFSDLRDVFNFLRKNELLKFDFPQESLSKLFEVIDQKSVINYYLETSQELDKVLNIFIRVNSGGTKLSYSDLLLPIATARWKSKDARQEITRFVDDLNQIGDGFRFEKDFVMKSCLVLCDIPDITFKGDNFNMSNMTTIEKNWEQIKKAIRIAVELVSGFGYNKLENSGVSNSFRIYACFKSITKSLPDLIAAL